MKKMIEFERNNGGKFLVNFDAIEIITCPESGNGSIALAFPEAPVSVSAATTRNVLGDFVRAGINLVPVLTDRTPNSVFVNPEAVRDVKMMGNTANILFNSGRLLPTLDSEKVLRSELTAAVRPATPKAGAQVEACVAV